MSGQRFIAREPFAYPNGAIGWRPGGPFDCLGPYAKVTNCPIAGTDLRRTCYATGYADTYFSVPARTQINGATIKGYFNLVDDGAIEFRVLNSEWSKLYRLPASVAFTEAYGANYCKVWIVLVNGFQVGGDVDASGAGNLTFDTIAAAAEWASVNYGGTRDV